MTLLKFEVSDILVLKKPHPCKNNEFKVLRGGQDVRIACTLCGRDLTLPREKLEKSIKQIKKANEV